MVRRVEWDKSEVIFLGNWTEEPRNAISHLLGRTREDSSDVSIVTSTSIPTLLLPGYVDTMVQNCSGTLGKGVDLQASIHDINRLRC